MSSSSVDRALSTHEIAIEEDSNLGVVRKDYYDGTISGCLDKYRGIILTVFAVIFIFVVSVSIVIIYSTAGDDDTFDDEDCWPFSCPSSDISSEMEGDDNYYWEPSNTTTTVDSNWGYRLPSPTNRDLYDIIHFSVDNLESTYVAVGDDSTVLISVNGTNWELLPPLESNPNLVSITFSADTFYIEASDGSCFKSYNLVDWVPSLHSFSTGIASTNIISVGVEHNSVWLRDLSMTWIRTTVHDVDTINDITFGNGIFILLGTTHFEFQPDARYPCVWISEDGISWDMHLVSDNILENSEELQIALAPTANGRGIFLVFADKLYTSGTGLVWLPVVQTPWISSAAPSSLDCGGNGYCAAISSGGTQTVISESSDYGQTWSSTIIGSNLLGLCDNDEEIFTSIGENGVIIQGLSSMSINGILWERVAPQFGNEVSSIVFGEGTFVASSESYVSFQSEDGLDWNGISSPSLSNIAHGDNIFIGVYSNGITLNIYKSEAAVNWTVVETFTGFYDISYFTFDGHQFILCATGCSSCSGFDDDDENNDSELSNIIYQSSNGLEWNELILSSNLSPFIDFSWDSSSNCYYSITSDGFVYVSTDISLWSKKKVTDDVFCNAIDVNQQTGVALVTCINSDNNMVLATSSNCGSTWNVSPCLCESCGIPTTVYYNYGDNMFYIGGKSILRTEEGLSLEITSINPVSVNSMESILIANGILMALSEGAIISSSTQNSPFLEQECDSQFKLTKGNIYKQ